jgi:GAF domain-containing protein
VLDDAVTTLMEVMGAQAGVIELFEEEKETISLSASRGFSEACLGALCTVWQEGSTSGAILKTGEPVIAAEILDDEHFPLGWLQKEGFRSVASVLLRTPQNPLGVLSLAWL